MDVFNDLYQQLIIDHNKNPKNFKTLVNANHSAEGHNPLCGDEITVSFIKKDGIIEERWYYIEARKSIQFIHFGFADLKKKNLTVLIK